jgi:hypothetical protein
VNLVTSKSGSDIGTSPFSSDIWQPFPASKIVVCFIGMLLPIALFYLSHDTTSCDWRKYSGGKGEKASSQRVIAKGTSKGFLIQIRENSSGVRP